MCTLGLTVLLLCPPSFFLPPSKHGPLQSDGSRDKAFFWLCLFVCLGLTLSPANFSFSSLHRFQTCSEVDGRDGRDRENGVTLRFLKSSSPKWEVTICQRVVSVLVVPCQTVGSIIRARGRQESRVNELVGNLESRYHTLAPKLLIKTVTLISGYEKIHKTECTSVRERKQSRRRARTDLALTLVQLLAILQYTVIPSRLSLRLTTRAIFEQETERRGRRSKKARRE